MVVKSQNKFKKNTEHSKDLTNVEIFHKGTQREYHCSFKQGHTPFP